MEIDKSAVRALKKDHAVEVHFERVAVLPDYIKAYNLPTRPSKKSDPRAEKFEGESVEIDSMPMDALREMVRECIIKHINPQESRIQRSIEEQERATLTEIMNQLGVA